MDHLHAVVGHRVVAARDVGAAVQPPVRGGEVEHRRRDLADVHDVEAARAGALDEGRLEVSRRFAVVAPDADGAAAVAPDQRGVGTPDLTEDVRVDVGTDAAAYVVGAKDVRVEHWGRPVRPDYHARSGGLDYETATPAAREMIGPVSDVATARSRHAPHTSVCRPPRGLPWD